MLDCLMDSLLDTIKILPYLFVTFIILEFLEHKIDNRRILKESNRFGPLLGGVFGGLPQCGFSSMASSLFSKRVITIGTLIAVFLSTSDEMLPIMIGEKVDITLVLKIVGFKILIGITIGYLIDFIFRRKREKPVENIKEMCDEEHCSCEKDGVLLSSIKHTIKIGLFILLANIFIGLVLEFVGEDNLSNILKSKNILTYFACSIIGLIPNCASSVVMTKLYLANFLTIGNLLSGLLTGSGLGILLLFKTNKNIKENIGITTLIYFIGVLIGIIVDFVV